MQYISVNHMIMRAQYIEVYYLKMTDFGPSICEVIPHSLFFKTSAH